MSHRKHEAPGRHEESPPRSIWNSIAWIILVLVLLAAFIAVLVIDPGGS